MNHHSSDAGPRRCRRWIPKATHGVVLLIGFLVWRGLHGERVSNDSQSAEAVRQVLRPAAASQASAWIDARLARIRETDPASKKEESEPTTMAEFLEKYRKEKAKWGQTRNDDLNSFIAKADKMHGPVDLIALRAALREKSGNQESQVLFLHWLDRDPEGALAELMRNRHLQELGYLPALLERKLGIAWLVGKVVDGEIPFPLRSAMAQELGSQAAHGPGLAGLLGHYNSIADPQLKVQMIWSFTSDWPLDEPQSVAQFLASGVPMELRDALLKQWANPYYGKSPWELKWLAEICSGLGPEFTRKYCAPSGSPDPESPFGPEIARMTARQSMTLGEAVQDCIVEGKSTEEAVAEAIRIKIYQALDGGGDLVDSFGEGKLTRTGFLDELRSRIPGSEAYPIALELEAWSRIAWAADPQEVASWAAELATRGDMGELMKQTFSSGNLYGDPRIPLRLDRYRIVTKGMKDDYPMRLILGHAAWEWTRWQSVSPGNAEAWRYTLPTDEPLLSAIRDEEDMNRLRKGSP